MAKAPATPVHVGSVQVAKTMHGTLEWAARQASNPLLKFGAFDPVFGTFDVEVNLPGAEGEVYRVEVNRLHVVPGK